MHNDWRTVLSLVRSPSSYCKLLSVIVWSISEIVETGHLSWYKFSHRTSKLLPFWKPVNGTNTNVTVFSWPVYLIVTSFISFYVIFLLGIALIDVMPYRSTVLSELSSSSPQRQQHYYFFISLIFILYLLFVCVCPNKRICLENSHIVVWFSIKKDVR